MVGFALFAAACFWRRVQLRQSAGPVYYELPATPGPQRLTLHKPGLSPGYLVRLVRRTDRSFEKALNAQLCLCRGRIVICENLALTMHTFDPDGIIEFDSEYSDVVLAYEASPEGQSLLETAAVEVRCPSVFQKPMGSRLAGQRADSRGRLCGFLCLLSVRTANPSWPWASVPRP